MALLVVAGVLVGTGALLHPHVPGVAENDVAVVRESDAWVPAHLLLTVGQAVAAVAAPVALVRLGGGNGVAGGGLLALGLALGAVGTLSAATLLAPAARVDGATDALFAVANLWTLGLGWGMLAVTSLGAALAGANLARDARRGVRVLGVVVLAGGVAFVLVTPWMIHPVAGTFHPWLHAFVLRGGALVLGITLVATAVVLARVTR